MEFVAFTKEETDGGLLLHSICSIILTIIPVYLIYEYRFCFVFRVYAVRIYVLFPRIGDYTVVDSPGHLSIHQNLFSPTRYRILESTCSISLVNSTYLESIYFLRLSSASSSIRIVDLFYCGNGKHSYRIQIERNSVEYCVSTFHQSIH